MEPHGKGDELEGTGRQAVTARYKISILIMTMLQLVEYLQGAHEARPEWVAAPYVRLWKA